MKRQLPTYEECLEIVSRNENFYEKVEMIDGTKISIFNYILNIPDFFKSPFEGSEVSAHELRGISFVHESTGVKRFLALHKFFNVNETDGGRLEDLAKMKIIRVQEKLDGSMISFIRVGERTIIKTKLGLSNDQVVLAQNYFNANSDLQSFVKESMDQGLSPIFELVSPHNLIVINYSKTELRLLQLRDAAGNYLDIYNNDLVNKYSILKSIPFPTLSLADLTEMQKTNQSDEGWVVTFERPDGSQQMNKLKTAKYFELHKLISDTEHEDTLIKLICEEKLDDAMSLLDKDNERRVYAEQMQEFLAHHIAKLVEAGMELHSKYPGEKNRENNKAFAAEHLNHPLFSIVTYLTGKPLDKEVLVKVIKERIIEDTKHLLMARKFLKDNGFKLQAISVEEEG